MKLPNWDPIEWVYFLMFGAIPTLVVATACIIWIVESVKA